LSGLHPKTTYYWQVLAWNGSLGPTYADGSSTAFSSFTTQAAPGAFTKSTPLNGDNDQPTNLTLSWQSTSPVTSYDYCYGKTNNICAAWYNAGMNTNVTINGLSSSATYYWQVRAWNNLTGPTYANDGNWWVLTTQPEDPNKLKSLYIPFITR
jgi:hypothetical protein